MSSIGSVDISKVMIGSTEVEAIFVGSTQVYQNKIKIPYPVLSGSYTYNGASQTASFTNYDVTTMTATGLSGTNAGTYTATFTPRSGYCWMDKSESAYSISWSIAQKSITGATVTLGSSLTYNGASQTQSVSSVVKDGLNVTYSVSGNTGTNAGSYTLTCTANGNFVGSVTKAWSIAKASGSVSLSSYSGTITGVYGTTGSFTISRAGNGTISVSSSNTSVATVSLSGTIATMTAVASGSATIYVSVAAGTNHNATSTSYALTSKTHPAGALYWDGDECTSLTGGWILGGAYSGIISRTKQSNCLRFGPVNHDQKADRVDFSHNNRINLTNYSKVKMLCNITDNSSQDSHLIIRIANAQISTSDSGSITAIDYKNQRTETDKIVELNISSVSGNYYVCPECWAGYCTYCTFEIKRIWLE